MNSIQIDDQVFAELSHRATGFHVTPNDVLRRILNLSAPTQAAATPQPAPPPVASTLTEFIKSERFQRHHQVIDRYLIILGWLHSAHPKQFAEAALKFHRGSRAYFAKSEKEILESGDGSPLDRYHSRRFGHWRRSTTNPSDSSWRICSRHSVTRAATSILPLPSFQILASGAAIRGCSTNFNDERDA